MDITYSCQRGDDPPHVIEARARREGFIVGLRHAATLVRNHEFSDECYADDVDATLRALAEKLERAAKEGEK